MPLGILFRGQKLPGFGMLQIVRVGIFYDQNQGILFHSHTNLNPPVLFRAGSGSLDGVIQSVSQHNAQITLINGELFRNKNPQDKADSAFSGGGILEIDHRIHNRIPAPGYGIAVVVRFYDPVQTLNRIFPLARFHTLPDYHKLIRQVMPFPVKFLRETALLVDLIGDEIQLAYVGSLFILLPEKLDELQINLENEDVDEKENAKGNKRKNKVDFLADHLELIIHNKNAAGRDKKQKDIVAQGNVTFAVLFYNYPKQKDKENNYHFR